MERILELLRYIFGFLLFTLFMLCYYYLFGGDSIFGADVSDDAVFHVELQKGKNYELWVLDMNGPERVDLAIRSGSYVPYEATFQLMHPEGDYIPYHPGFSVKETGTYDIIVHPLDPGSIRIGVMQDTGINPNRISRDLGNVLGNGNKPSQAKP